MESEPWVHREARVNGVRLHYVEAGRGPLVVLLHGFPEFWYSWRRQIGALADAGFHVVAPDMRGYNLSEKPRRVDDYRIDALVEDVAALIRHCGEARAHVAGHDWGGGVAWATAILRPDVVHRLVVLNAPHPVAFARELRTPGQLLRSWYMLFFQIPRLPEALIRYEQFGAVRRTLRTDPVRANAFSRKDAAEYVRALSQPGALTAAIHYYRAGFRHSPLHLSNPIQSPTLLIWGERDRYLGIRLTQGLEPWIPRLRVERIPDASHWVLADAPERVSRLMVEFLSS